MTPVEVGKLVWGLEKRKNRGELKAGDIGVNTARAEGEGEMKKKDNFHQFLDIVLHP